MSEALSQIYANDAEWRGSHPFNEMEGVDAVAANVWQPLLRAFPDLERRDDLFVAGLYEDRHYVAACGHYLGTFKQDWLGIPATGQPVFIRYGEVHEVRDGKIVQSTCLWDVSGCDAAGRLLAAAAELGDGRALARTDHRRRAAA